MMPVPTSEVSYRLIPGPMFGCRGQVTTLGMPGLLVDLRDGNGQCAQHFLELELLKVQLAIALFPFYILS